MKLRSLFSLALLAAAPALFAGETGSISGRVADANGGPLPGVLVKVSGPQLPAGRTASTSASGAYNFQRLLPGAYTVEAELTGIGKASKQVTVQVDNDYQIDLALTGGAMTTVEVVAAAVDTKSTEVNFNYGAEEIKNLPLARSYSGLLQLVPGAADPDGVGVSFSGGSRQDNKYLVDGVNITNPAYGTLIVETNELDIADFNVKKGAITAEFGRTFGGIVNAVTRSGTNDFRGAIRFEALPDAFIAENKNSSAAQTIDRYTAAGNLGFPVLKDFLFGYVSARYFSSTKSGQSSAYGTQPDTKVRNQDYFGKVTGNFGQSLLLNASIRALPTKSENTFDSLNDAATAGYDTDVTNYVSNVTASWFVSANSFIEAKYVHLTESDTIDAQHKLADRPQTIDPANLGAYGAFADSVNRGGGNAGVYSFANFGDDFKRDEFKLTASQFLDIGPTQHQIKIGGGVENDTYELVRSTNGWGTLVRNITCPAVACGTSTAGQIRARYYTLQPVQTGKARTFSIFLQDQISWNRFTATIGFLANRDDFAQVGLDGTRYNFMDFMFDEQFQPRLGVVWNAELLKGDKIYANFGRYYGLDQKSTSRSFAPFRIREDEAYFNPTTGVYRGQNVRGSSAGKVVPDGLRSPFIDEYILGYGAPVSRYLTVEAYYQYRTTKDIFEDVPIDPVNYFGSFMAANLPGARRRYRAITLDVNKRLSDRWSANLNYTYSELTGNFDLDYTSVAVFNTSSIIEDGPGINSAEPNRYGTLSQDRPHILKLFASYDLPFGVTLGGYYRFQSGAAWEARGRDSNGSFYRYLEPAGSRRLPGWSNVDLLAAYNFRFGGAMGLRVEARVQNVFDTQTGLTVSKNQYNDPYVNGNPASTLGPQGTTQPLAAFGTYTSFAQPRRLTLTGVLEF